MPNYFQETINTFSEYYIFYIVVGICIIEPIASPLAIFIGLLLCYCKQPNFMDYNNNYPIYKEDLMKLVNEDFDVDDFD